MNIHPFFFSSRCQEVLTEGIINPLWNGLSLSITVMFLCRLSSMQCSCTEHASSSDCHLGYGFNCSQNNKFSQIFCEFTLNVLTVFYTQHLWNFYPGLNVKCPLQARILNAVPWMNLVLWRVVLFGEVTEPLGGDAGRRRRGG